MVDEKIVVSAGSFAELSKNIYEAKKPRWNENVANKLNHIGHREKHIVTIHALAEQVVKPMFLRGSELKVN